MDSETVAYVDEGKRVSVERSQQSDVNGFPNFLVVREDRGGERFAVRYQRTVTHREIVNGPG